MCATHLLIMLNLSVKFHQICFSSLCDIAETRFVTDGQKDGRTDGRTDGAILICHPKFLRGHKKGLFQIMQLLRLVFTNECYRSHKAVHRLP